MQAREGEAHLSSTLLKELCVRGSTYGLCVSWWRDLRFGGGRESKCDFQIYEAPKMVVRMIQKQAINVPH